MITEEQTSCPKCKSQFSQHNLPRLLTMCGHTFCEKCIRQLTLKKKTTNKYKIVCPLDKMMIQISAPNPTAFPKNLSILNLVKKKSEINFANNRISNIEKGTVSSLGSGNTLQNLQNQISDKLDTNRSKDQQSRRASFFTDNICPQTCLLHQKPLELVCVRDFQRICSSCAIFGEHRGHTIKNYSQVQQTVKKLSTQLKDFLKQQKLLFQKLQSKQVHDKLQALLKNKKSQIHKQITKKFKQLLEHVILVEKKVLSNLDKKIEQYRGKIKGNSNEKLLLKQKYRDWEENLKQKIQSLASQNQQEKLKTALKSESFVELSQKNLQTIASLQLDLFQEAEKMLDNFAISADDEQIRSKIKQYCKFQDCSNSFLDVNSSRVNISQILNQEILLDDIQDAPLSKSFVKVSEYSDKPQKSEGRYRKMTSSSVYSGMLQGFKTPNNKLNRVKSSNKQRFFLSPNRANSALKSNKLLGFGNNKPSLPNILKSKDISAKYQAKIQSVVKGQSDVLDLTNAELGNDTICSILEYTKDSPVAIVKLVRNKINDDCFIKSIPFLKNIVMLNVSKNQLTQKSLDYVLAARKQGGLCSLKSLMIGQNKIVERKNKQIFEQLKKTGINVCI